MSKTVLIIGGYGVFGGRLALALSKNETLKVGVAGRDLKKAADFCQDTPCHPYLLDRTADDLIDQVKRLAPFVLIDAAGPFQTYGDRTYALAEAALAAGAHYVDLSDDADFTKNITQFDHRATAKQLTFLSGVSSVPALSSAVVGALMMGLKNVHHIESAILPGNKAPRGLSVIKAILSQAGAPLTLWRGGLPHTVPGWSGLKSFTLKKSSRAMSSTRWASYIGAPDLSLFPQRYAARNVSFRAGLDLKLMHFGLWLLSGLVRFGLMTSLISLAIPLRHIASLLERFGSDTGAMVIQVTGLTDRGDPVQKKWELRVEQGEGPNVPTLPAQILVAKLIEGSVTSGARPCLEEFTLNEAAAALRALPVETTITYDSVPLVFQSVLGEAFDMLSPTHRDLHTVLSYRRWQGHALVRRGRTLLSKLVGALAGFPNASDEVEVQVEMERTKSGETWTRTFGTKRFRSYLTAETSNIETVLYERFGALKFEIALTLKEDKLHFPVRRGRFLGIPLPKFLLPLSNAEEFVDELGRARFYVDVSLPICGHVATYTGWLTPDDEITSELKCEWPA